MTRSIASPAVVVLAIIAAGCGDWGEVTVDGGLIEIESASCSVRPAVVELGQQLTVSASLRRVTEVRVEIRSGTTVVSSQVVSTSATGQLSAVFTASVAGRQLARLSVASNEQLLAQCGFEVAGTGACGGAGVCGDGACRAECAETCSTCAADCGPCPVCGNGVRESGELDESCGSCIEDCCSEDCACGQQYYVSTGGDDANPGTLAQPWRTLQKAMNAAEAGSTVNIRAGTYQERLTMNVSGTAGKPITFQPYGFVGSPDCGGYTGVTCAGESVVVDYAFLGVVQWADTPPVFSISGKQYIVIQGITFKNYSVDGPMHLGILINGGSQHVDFRWVRVENFRNVHAAGLDQTTALSPVRVGWSYPSTSGADYVTFSDCQFYNNKSNMSEVLTYDVGSGYGVVERCHFQDSDGIALSVYRGAHDYVWRDNRLEWIGLKRDGTQVYPGSYSGIALYNDGGWFGLIMRNRVHKACVGFQSLAEVGGGGGTQQPVHDIVFRDNVIYGSLYGTTIGTWYSSTDGSSIYNHDYYNNTFYDCDVGMYTRPFTAASVRVRNNIVAACDTAYVNAVGWNVGSSFDYNLYYGGGSGPDAHKVTLEPQLVSPAAGDFRLGSSSPAVNAGDPATTTSVAGTTDALGLPRIVGGRIDIGANERQ